MTTSETSDSEDRFSSRPTSSVWNLVRSRELGSLLAVLLVATITRCYALGYEAFWCDEAYTALNVRLPLGEMISRLFRIDDAPPLFYLLEKLTASLAGDSEASLRVVSVAAGIFAVAVIAWVGAVQRGSPTDRWAAAFMAVATTGIFHARQARSYALLLLLATILVLAARGMLTERRRWGVFLAIAAAMLCLSHHVGIVLVLASLVLWPLGNAGRPRLREWLLWHTPALVIWASLWIGASAQLGVHAEQNAWVVHYWKTHSLLWAPLYSLGLFLPAGLPASELSVGFSTPGAISIVWTIVSLSFGALCLVVGVLRSVRRRPDRALNEPRAVFVLLNRYRVSDETRAVLLEVGFLALPLLALLIASSVVTPVYVLGRTDVLAYPAFVLLIGRGLAVLPRSASWMFLVFWTAMSLLSLAPSYGLGSTRLAKGVDRRLAEGMISAGLAPEDWVVHTFMTSPTIEYYLDRGGASHHASWFPRIAGENTASEYPTPADSVDVYRAQAIQLRSMMEVSLPEDGDVWIFGLIAPATEAAITKVRESRTATAEQIGYPVSVLLYSLVGRAPVPVAFLYHQDWVAGERVVLRIPRRSWARPEDLQRIEIRVRS